MSKISITAPHTVLEEVVDELYELGIMDLDVYEGELETGAPMEGSEDISELLVDIRSLLSKMDHSDERQKATVDEVRNSISTISAKLKDYEAEKDALKNTKHKLNDKKTFYSKLKGVKTDLSKFKEIDSLNYVIIEKENEFRARTKFYDIFHGSEASLIAYKESEEQVIDEEINRLNAKKIEAPFIEEGTPSDVLRRLSVEIKETEKELEALEQTFSNISEKWAPKLAYVEDYLTEKIQKAEAPLSFGTTDKAFIVEGWMPTAKLEAVKNALKTATNNKIHFESSEGENPPVKYHNNSIVQPFEALTDLVSRPKYGELDPSFLILLTFPLFFGLMIGDAGYGLSMSVVFYAAMKLFPAASDMFKALLWTSAATFVFGLLYGEMFGFQIYESPFYRADWWTEIFYLTIGIGVAHVNLGLLIGAYNEYIHHGLLEAVFAKISWIFFQIAAVAGYLTYATYGSTPGIIITAGMMVPTLLMMYKGEGVQALVEIPSLVSNILSYLRLFGVCMAAYTLAGTVNAIAVPAIASGTMMGIAGGTLILIAGHIILTFIKIMEGFLQGIRLHYVEQFGWFYTGGGRKYSPFGGKE